MRQTRGPQGGDAIRRLTALLFVAGLGHAYDGPGAFELRYGVALVEDLPRTVLAPASWDLKDWRHAGEAVLAVGTVGAIDPQIRRAMQDARNKGTDAVARTFEPFGTRYAEVTWGACYAGGLLLSDEKLKRAGLDGAGAGVIAASLLAPALKWVAGRWRPDRGRGAYAFEPFAGGDSFPSGHSLRAFATAGAIEAQYDNLWVSAACYGVAALVAFARVDHDAHWASDTLAGALIGAAVGRAVSAFNRSCCRE